MGFVDWVNELESERSALITQRPTETGGCGGCRRWTRRFCILDENDVDLNEHNYSRGNSVLECLVEKVLVVSARWTRVDRNSSSYHGRCHRIGKWHVVHSLVYWYVTLKLERSMWPNNTWTSIEYSRRWGDADSNSDSRYGKFFKCKII